MSTILFVSTDQEFMSCYGTYIKFHGHDVTYCVTTKQAKSLLLKKGFDLLVIAADFLGEKNIILELIEDILIRFNTRVYVLQKKFIQEEELAYLDTGADMVSCLPIGPRIFLTRIEALLRRTKKYHSSIGSITIADYIYDSVRRCLQNGTQTTSLTKSEAAILTLLIQNKGNILTKSQLEQHLGMSWGAIKTHVRHLRQKLEPNPSTPVYVRAVIGGYYFVSA